MMATIEDVLTFWFGELKTADDLDTSKSKLWWVGGPELDAEIKQRFGDRVADALAGKLEAWRESPRGCLALVILLDQFTRNIGRGTPDAFEGDGAALEVSLEAQKRGFDRELRLRGDEKMTRTTKPLHGLTWFHVALGAAPVVLFALVDCGQPARWDDAEGVQQELAAGTYTFGTSTTTGKCIDVAGSSTANGAAVQQWTCNGGAAQSFRIENMGGASRVINVGSGKCLDVTQFGTANGTKVQQWSCSGSAAQAFRIEDLGSGRVRFVNTNSNKCLDVTGVGTADGARIQIWSCAANSIAQTFRATKEGTTTTGGSTTASTTTGPATTSGATGGGTWRRANLTNFTSYPDPGSDECVNFNGCMWAGQFAFVNGKQPESWVMANNILAVHSKDANIYKLKTLRLRQGTHQIDAKVYDMCADSDCSGCCTANSRETGFLIDIEKYTMQRFGSGGGIVEWMCLDCP